jgi:hypothetical protein
MTLVLVNYFEKTIVETYKYWYKFLMSTKKSEYGNFFMFKVNDVNVEQKRRLSPAFALSRVAQLAVASCSSNKCNSRTAMRARVSAKGRPASKCNDDGHRSV